MKNNNNQELAIVNNILQNYPGKQESLIFILQDIQSELKYIPEHTIDLIAQRLSVPGSHIYSVISFYSCFHLTPLGKHRVDICQGTACHVRGSGMIADQVIKQLGIKPGETTPDGEITVSNVNCVGACAMGPVAVVDGKYYGELTAKKLSKAIKEHCACKKEEKEIVKEEKDEETPAFRLKDIEHFDAFRKELIKKYPLDKKYILVCAGTGCIANGSIEVAEKLKEELAKVQADIPVKLDIKKTGCHGFCEKGPLVVFHPNGAYYTRVKEADVAEIVEKTVLKNEVIEKLLYKDPVNNKVIEDYREIPFYSGQERNVLKNNTRIDPESITDYIVHGGYAGLSKALLHHTPLSVIEEVEKSGLRGCGGGGFPTGRKWRSCINAQGNTRYIVCNADEGDPGAFMDRSIIEGTPYSVIEGMTIGAYAIGAEKGYIYVREEYPLAVERLSKAIKTARAYGLLGNNILETGFNFDIQINRGAGAFVCGESTALMQSIAGYIGEPRAKYVRSVEKGLYDQPTVLNNVETFANVPLIIENGAKWFASSGTEKSKGTKAFSVVGKVKNTGLVEVPMGTTLRSIIYETCGGILNDKEFKAVQTGGPSGGCLPEDKLDLEVDFDSLTKEGSMMGSGGMIVMDENTCMVDVALYFTRFLLHESCGKCAACRMGLSALSEILERICNGKGEPIDISRMEELFEVMDDSALCGLGKTASNPVRSTLAHFRNEYDAHIKDKKCPAKICKALITYKINENCTGCSVCAKACPQNAISGEKKKMYHIDNSICDRCGICISTCKFEAISVI